MSISYDYFGIFFFLAFIDQTLRLFWSVSTTQEGPSYLLFYV